MNQLTWHHLELPDDSPQFIDSRKRLTLIATLFGLIWLAILARASQLEWRHGTAFRAEALKPLRREIALPAVRGRLLARDGTVLAQDEQLLALAVHYRYLQNSPDEIWLRTQARLRLPKQARRNRQRLNEESAALRAELRDLNHRLAALCQMTPKAWQSRVARIENRVESIAASVNERRWERFEQDIVAPEPETAADRAPWWNVAANLPDALRALGTPEDATWETIIVKEEVDYHIVVEDLPAKEAAEIRKNPQNFPGVRVIEVPRRSYPHGNLAANVLGHLGRDEAAEVTPQKPGVTLTVGVQGLERILQNRLAGASGMAVEQIDRRGQLQATTELQPAINGADVRLTLDLKFQQTAEELLDLVMKNNRHARGAALVLLDIHSGDVLTLASAPRFDPNAFALADSDAIRSTLTNPGQPMFNRATRMALPPGSLAQPFAAVAMLESSKVPAHAAFHCEGYLRDPEGLRCAIYQQQGMGHEDVTLFDAIAKNCRVYFAHYAGVIGAGPLVHSAARFGFGNATGIELTESKGTLPQPTGEEQPNEYRVGDAQLMALGQGSFTVTPLQMARGMAAIANDGILLLPRTVSDMSPIGNSATSIKNDSNAIAQIRVALCKSVEMEDGDNYGVFSIDGLSVAGLTATGPVAGEQSDHAWCAGYVPAENPQYAFAIAIEHGGEGRKAAAPVIKRFLARLAQLGCFEKTVAKYTGL